MTVVEALQRSVLFRDFTETGLRIFASVAAEKAVPAGSPLFVENMVGESMFILKTGTVRVTQRGPEGERELAVLGPGEHLGALALLGKSVRLVSAVAATPCEVLELAQRDFVRLQPQKPQACLKLALAIAADLSAKVAESRELLRGLAAARPSAP
ncbi:cyclic nucleotide-binding protein [Anaeromyxobacter sp. K]|uniref:cyclic nucleotide-binding domain-containing protein n=1 Tax=Anaeromyxobacter sp. (strain K) TaxID=447217 RepID=UPI00015F91EC|nr:cyclic nucleotide-binding domain-containing protein [Anaeromyxobacter sp. K]ACG72747.1 cyclic nucleotide-binding protein [Anaeromyxobacter sp. K]